MGSSPSPRPGDKAEAPPKRGLAPSHRSAWGDGQSIPEPTARRHNAPLPPYKFISPHPALQRWSVAQSFSPGVPGSDPHSHGGVVTQWPTRTLARRHAVRRRGQRPLPEVDLQQRPCRLPVVHPIRVGRLHRRRQERRLRPPSRLISPARTQSPRTRRTAIWRLVAVQGALPKATSLHIAVAQRVMTTRWSWAARARRVLGGRGPWSRGPRSRSRPGQPRRSWPDWSCS